MKDYKSLSQNDRRNCTVSAVSKSMNVSMEDAYRAMADQGRIHNCGAHMIQVRNAVRQLGGTRTDRYKRKIHIECKYGTLTTRNVAEWFSTGRYIMCTNDHAFACINGTIDDWSADRKSRVTKVWEITGEVR